jgi:hypothetical protein
MLAACSSTHLNTADAGVDNRAATKAAFTCDYNLRCIPGAPQLYGDRTACVARMEAAAKLTLAGPGVTVTQEALQACADKLATVDCIEGPGPAVPECDFKGALPIGAVCGDNAQCVSGSCRGDLAQPGVCGTCRARAAEGQSCNGADCELGLYCARPDPKVPEAVICVKPAAVGEACNGDGLPCVNPGRVSCVNGKCKEDLMAGAACTSVDQVGGCADALSLVCKATNPLQPQAGGKCTEPIYAPVGSKCGLDPSTYDLVLCTASFCVGATRPTATGTCTAFLDDGAACTSGPTSTLCRPPANCSGGKCVVTDPLACK